MTTYHLTYIFDVDFDAYISRSRSIVKRLTNIPRPSSCILVDSKRSKTQQHIFVLLIGILTLP